MFLVVPCQVRTEISAAFLQIPEPSRIFRITFYRAERRLDKRIVIGGSRPHKSLRHFHVFQHPLNRLALQLPAPVVEHFRPLILRQVQDVLGPHSIVQELAGFLHRLLPADPPRRCLAGILIQQQVQIQITAPLIRRQIADIPTPTLVRPRQRPPCRRQTLPIIPVIVAAPGHQPGFSQKPVGR